MNRKLSVFAHFSAAGFPNHSLRKDFTIGTTVELHWTYLQRMFKNYLVVAWRNLVKGKIHSAINIMGLCIGMSVAMLIGLWLHNELSYDKNFKHYDRIAQVIKNLTNNGETQTWWNVPYPLANELRTNYGSDFRHVVMSVNVN